MKKRKIFSGRGVTSIISQGLRIVGDVRVEDELIVNGEIVGDVVSMDRIVVGVAGVVAGSLLGGELIVNGRVDARVVIVLGKLTIGPHARISGKVFANVVDASHGASLDGNLCLGRSDELPTLAPDSGAEQRAECLRKMVASLDSGCRVDAAALVGDAPGTPPPQAPPERRVMAW